MAEISERQAVQFLHRSFEYWGLPRRIKIDNGLPFVHPHQRDIPTLPVLWCIGLGVEVKQNDPGRPQQNGTVEGLQGICRRWVNPQNFDSAPELQLALHETLRLQREVYRVPARKHQTRLSLYPELKENLRRFDPADFQWERIRQYFASQVWQRSVNSRVIHFFHQQIYLGKPFNGQQVTITYDPLEELLLIRATDGRLLKTSNKPLVTEKQILEFVELSMNM